MGERTIERRDKLRRSLFESGRRAGLEEAARIAEGVNPLAPDDDPKSVFLLVEEIAAAIRYRINEKEGG